MSDDLAMMPACALLERYRRGDLSPVEATEAVLARIDRLEPLLNTYAFLDRAGALRRARDSEERWRRRSPCGPLDGVPLSLKDLVLTRDMPTGRGSLALPPDPGSEDAPVAARLREAGAVILGKTTTSELGWKGVADCPATGITRNPWDPDRTPGASSGGAVAGLAAGLATLASGSDGGGSIRIPAAFTGVYGLKPTYGQVPQYPPSMVGTVSHLGPLARTVADAALLYSVMAQPDPRDWYASPSAQAVAPADLERGVGGLRIAYSPDLGYANVDPEVAALVSAAAAVFSELGAEVEEQRVVFDCPLEAYRVHFLAAFAHLGRKMTAAQRARLDPGLEALMEAGQSISLADYLDAVAQRERLGIETALFHTRYDLLLTPTLPIAAFEVGRDTPHESTSCPAWLDWNPFTYPFNLTQQPAASVPCGLTGAGLPVGLQIVGAKGADALVLRASRAFEAARPFPALPVERLLARAAAAAGAPA